MNYNQKYTIKVSSSEEFESVVLKLISMGYVFSNNRLRKIEEIRDSFSNSCREWRYIIIHTNDICKMVLHSLRNHSSYYYPNIVEITIEEFQSLKDL